MRTAALALAVVIFTPACASQQLTAECAWGAPIEQLAEHCARQNFGPKGARFLRDTEARCSGCAGIPLLEADLQYCTLACAHRRRPPA